MTDRNGDAASPRYVAMIADGNGRWATARGLSPNAGHEAGADTLRARIADAVEFGVRELSVYSFSTENWSRPVDEVDGLVEMLARRIGSETLQLHEHGVRMRFIGRREGLPAELGDRMRWAETLTAGNRRIVLAVALNYGARSEIVDAARRFQGGSEDDFRACLYAPDMHDPDLLIRTGAEKRLSNYLLWQAAHSELVFRDELWPDFTREAFAASLADFRGRRRGLEASSRDVRVPKPSIV